MRQATIKKGQLILLYADQKKWLLKAQPRQFHTHKGIVDLSQVIGKNYGSEIKSSLNQVFHILKPNLHDFIMNVKRPTQIIYPKDIGLIILKLDIGPGKKILEIGTGSAALTLAMASLVRPNGHVFSYEKRSSFVRNAEQNISLTDLTDLVTIRNQDASKGVNERRVDAAIIDIGDPWTAVEAATKALKPGHPLASFSPTINQVEKTAEALINLEYVDLETVECLLRNITVKPGRTRPQTVMIGHTGYITFARKTL